MKKEYSIKKTTREQRRRYNEEASALLSLGSNDPTKEDQMIINQYIEGDKELFSVIDSLSG
ncbi:hypothetical protein [Paenibacillus odorifer]|uniref:Uncharacterized protein n=1 Tax=Paenibacillus odorifer TaxID=189426 RepID=A0A1R0XKR4_9BACL|nr:hypothetical protein [Paenibacillus odorifer]OMD35676.1 hypothetical protein BSK52_26615 [Paenibacillus odorifer]